ncbi:MAG: stage III sporulation protein AA [Firmicutes bacterium]|nr:stage III sporulation protein AA [Bacillota bacterium]
MASQKTLTEQIRSQLSILLPNQVARVLDRLPDPKLALLQEVRLRVGRPVALRFADGEWFLSSSGALLAHPPDNAALSKAELEMVLDRASRSSLYAYEEELRRGYLTLPGGHRLGLVGRAVLQGESLVTQRDLEGANLRVAREIVGCSRPLLASLMVGELPATTLLLSPPGAGKTTLLRDLVRAFSTGESVPQQTGGYQVGLCDERSEVAGLVEGIPQFDVGPRTDILDGCPKREGIPLLLRAMGPQVIACDEIGGADDVEALQEAARAGVSVFATAHARDLVQLRQRPALRSLIEERYFDRYIVLSCRRGVGTIENITDAEGHPLVWTMR